jgi:RHS repeat-associated protein
VFVLATWLLPAAPCLAQAQQTWTLRVDIGDGSTLPEGIPHTYSAVCFYRLPAPPVPGPDWFWVENTSHERWFRTCGVDLPIGTDVQINVDNTPYRIMAGPNQDLYPYYYDNFSYTDCFLLPTCDSNTQVRLYAKAGNIEGFVRLASDRTTPIPSVIVAAYTTDGGLVATAVTDANGHYQFTRTGATPIDVANHWALQVDHEFSAFRDTFYGLDRFFKDYRVLVSPLGVTTPPPYVAAEPWTTVYPSDSARKDFYLGSPEGDKHDPNEKTGEEENPEYAVPPCPPDDPNCLPCEDEGKPIRVTTGSVHFEQTDAEVRGIRRTLAFSRRYDSRRAFHGLGGAFGRGWEHTLEKSISVVVPNHILRLDAGTGGPLYFQDSDGDGTFAPAIPLTERSRIVATGSGYSRLFGVGGSETYNAAGRLVAQTDRVNNVTSLNRDAAGRLTAIVLPGGRTLSLDYDGDHVSRLRGPSTTLAIYTYTPEGLLDRVEYPAGSGYVFTYDAQGQLLTISDLSGRVIETHTYASGKALTSEITGGQERITLSYGSGSTVATDAGGRTSGYLYGEIAGLRRTTSVSNGCSSCGQLGTWEHDSRGRLSLRRRQFETGSAEVASYTYDPNDNVASVTRPQGTFQYSYDPDGRMLTRHGPANAVTTWTYGAAGPLTITDPLNRTTTIEYTPSGQLESVTNAAGETTTFTYNGFGDLVSVEDPLGNTSTYGHDEFGRRATVTDGLNRTTALSYDTTGNVVRVTAPDGTHMDFAYDGGGRRKSSTDAAGRTTRYGYDAWGRLSTVQDAGGATTRYAYDVMSRLSLLTDSHGSATHYAYDAQGRMTQVTYPNGGVEYISYDVAGRIASATDRRGVIRVYEYDTADRVTRVRFSDGTPPKSFSYDANDRLLSAVNGIDTLGWTYDLAGGLVRETSARNGTSISYDYDNVGRRRLLSLQAIPFIAYQYDRSSRLIGLVAGERNFTFGYDNAGQRTTSRLPNGVATAYSYDNLGRLSGLEVVKEPTTPIISFGYSYDIAGNRATKASAGVLESYSYDALNRLTAVERTGSASGHSHYGYDAAGNRVTTQLDGVVTSSVHNELNQLISTQGGGVLRVKGTIDEAGTVKVNGQAAQMLQGNTFEATVESLPGANAFTIEATDGSGNARTTTYSIDVPSQAASYAYDPNGNLVSKSDASGEWTYDWSADNQLVSVAKGGVEVARFAYDALGRRVARVAGSVTTSWAYDGVHILRETVNDGSTTASYRYIYGPGIDEALAREGASVGSIQYFHADGLGSIVKGTDTAGIVNQTRRYDAWGNLEAGADQPGYGFTGREWEPEIGLYYYRARYYDPKIGRFVSADPIGFLGGENFYSYVRNSPTNLIDPSGLVDLNLFPQKGPDGIAWANASIIPSERGEFSLAGHAFVPPNGPPSAMADPNGARLTATDLAALIQSNPAWKEGKTVRIYACRVGSGNFAQDLANILKTKVWAPTGDIEFPKDAFVPPWRLLENSQWKQFSPPAPSPSPKPNQ